MSFQEIKSDAVDPASLICWCVLSEVFITKRNYKGSSSSCGGVGRHSVICGANARGREPRARCVTWLPWLPCQKGGNAIQLVRRFRVSPMLMRQKEKRKEKRKHNDCSRVPKHESESEVSLCATETRVHLCQTLYCDSFLLNMCEMFLQLTWSPPVVHLTGTT